MCSFIFILNNELDNCIEKKEGLKRDPKPLNRQPIKDGFGQTSFLFTKQAFLLGYWTKPEQCKDMFVLHKGVPAQDIRMPL